MNILVNARHMDVTDAIREFVEKKVARLPRFYDNVQQIQVQLSREADQNVAEMIVTAKRRNTFVATHRDPDLYASVDHCLQKISEQLRRHKDRVRDRKATPLSEKAT